VLLQGAGAIVMKKALELVVQYAEEKELDFKMVINCHDEWQAEVKEDQAEMFGELSVKAIIDAGEYYNFRCPLDGEYKIGKSWKDTH
jgi:DNA polymerase I-like protein with 3'-5' exonuclease and polymerase domains